MMDSMVAAMPFALRWETFLALVIVGLIVYAVLKLRNVQESLGVARFFPEKKQVEVKRNWIHPKFMMFDEGGKVVRVTDINRPKQATNTSTAKKS